MRVAINGFGRIGRAVLKIALDKNINVVAINDLQNPEQIEYLLKYDSVYGKYDKKVSVSKDEIIVGNKKIKLFSEKEPEKLPWKKLNVDVIIESTGVFRDKISAGKHLKAGAKKVLITAPAKGEVDFTIVPGVNHNSLKKEHKIISVASCTTNCISPLIKILKDEYKIESIMFNTIHAYTSSQGLVDGPNKRMRRGRSAGLNIVPSSTGASESVEIIMPELVGKIKGSALRVPIACGSIAEITLILNENVSVKEINELFERKAKKEYKGIVEYSEDELVSTDIIKNSYSAIFDSKLTEVNKNVIKISGWYDNEYGYSSRVIDVVKMLGH